MGAKRQTIGETLDWVSKKRPLLAPVLTVFGPVLQARADVATELVPMIRAGGPKLPEADSLRLSQGLSLLTGYDFAGAAKPLQIAAIMLLPELAKISLVGTNLDKLRLFFGLKVNDTADKDKEQVPCTDSQNSEQARSSLDGLNGQCMARLESLVVAVVGNENETIANLAREADLDKLLLDFVAGFVVSALLRAMVLAASTASDGGEADAESDEPAPWQKNEIWQQGYCPVCGALPSFSWLDKPGFDHKNAYLMGGGGKKHLYCGVCGADWAFQRGACPACDKKGSDAIEILQESGQKNGERLDWCTGCKGYCPCVDLREREFIPDPDALALGMMHLDMVAAKKKLRPLRPAFWNMF